MDPNNYNLSPADQQALASYHGVSQPTSNDYSLSAAEQQALADYHGMKNTDNPWQKLADNVLGGAAKFANSALDETGRIGKAIGDLPERAYNALGGNATIPSANEVFSNTTGALSNALDQAYGKNAGTTMQIADVAGRIAPYLLPTGSIAGALGSAGKAIESSKLGQFANRVLTGAATGGIASEADNPDVSPTAGAAVGGTLGALSPVAGKIGSMAGNSLSWLGKKLAASESAEPAQALGKLLDTISPVDEDIGKHAQDISNGMVSTTAKAMKDTANDLYAKAYPNPVSPALHDSIASNPIVGDTYNKTVNSMLTGSEPTDRAFQQITNNGQNIDSVAAYDAIQKRLGEVAQSMFKADQGNSGRLVKEAQQSIVNHLDSLPGNEAYTQARAAWSEGKTDLENLAKTPVGKLADQQGPYLGRTVDSLFNPAMDLNDQLALKGAFQNANPDVYSAMYRHAWDSKISGTSTGVEPTIYDAYNKVLGNDKNYQTMLAMAPDDGTRAKIAFMRNTMTDLKNASENTDNPMKDILRFVPGIDSVPAVKDYLSKTAVKPDIAKAFNDEMSKAINSNTYNKAMQSAQESDNPSANFLGALTAGAVKAITPSPKKDNQ